jgi:hypothetical protein
MELNEKYSSICALLNKAISDFELSLHADFSKYNTLETDWIKNGQIQKFEFCTELFWKTAKIYLFSLEEKIYTPKLTIKTLFQYQLISEDLYLGLMQCINDRNLLSHVYQLEIFNNIQLHLLTHFKSLSTAAQILTKLTIVDEN